MSRIEPAAIADLEEPEREAVARAEALMGFTANDVLTMARNPDLLRAVGELVRAVYAPGRVDDGLKRLIGLVTSTAAGCRYCMGHTALSSSEYGVPEDKLAEIWNFDTSPGYSPAERAALHVALHAGQSPTGVTDAMFDELARYFDADAQLEIVAVIAMFGFLNRWNATLGTELEERPAAALAKAERG